MICSGTVKTCFAFPRRRIAFGKKRVGGLLLHMRRCHCTSSSPGRCWPGTSGKFYTAASSSEPSSQRYRQYRCPGPGFKQANKHTQRQIDVHKADDWLTITSWQVNQLEGPLRNTVQPFVVDLYSFSRIWIFSCSGLKQNNWNIWAADCCSCYCTTTFIWWLNLLVTFYIKILQFCECDCRRRLNDEHQLGTEKNENAGLVDLDDLETIECNALYNTADIGCKTTNHKTDNFI